MGKGKPLLKSIVAGAKGEVVGIVRVIPWLEGPDNKYYNDKTEMAKVKPGEILVFHRSAPEDEQYMKIAAGFIANKGGETAHTNMVAKKLGKPSVTGVGAATDTLKTGQKVIVDGNTGTVWEYVEELVTSAPAPAGKSIAERITEEAKAKGITLNPAFLEKLKKMQGK